ncbi:MAG: hypothetical protein ACJAY7_001106 [Pseudohongiellaceae bacterium]
MIENYENNELNENRSDAQSILNSKMILVTIHGTGAGDPTKDKKSWWQEESEFLEQLGQRLDLNPEQVKIVPFLWEQGPNSEASRRKAGKRLYDLLRSYDDLNKDYCLIGHSHGGSVAYSALLQSVAEHKPLEGLKCWCTVGTPFLEYVKNKYLVQRLSGWRLGLYLLTFPTTLFAVFGSASLYFLVLSWPLAHLAFLALERHKGHAKSATEESWFTEKQKKMAAEQYYDTWFGLCHPEDEAISALTNIKDVNEEIIQSDFLIPLIPFAQFLILIVGWSLAHRFGAPPISVNLYFYDFLIIESLVFFLFLFVLFIFGFALKPILLLLGKPASRQINKIVWSQVRKGAWGDDVSREDVIKIAPYPANFSAKFSERMPESVASPLRDHSSNSAIKTLVKVREILGMTTQKKENKKGMVDLRSDLSKSLTWEELIHTSYFEVENFIDLIAVGLHKAGLSELKNDFISTSDQELLSAWYEDKKAP